MVDKFLRDVLPVFVELNDLKRIVSAGRQGSLATRLFRDAWTALLGGAEPAVLAWHITARAVAAARLGDIDLDGMVTAGLSPNQAIGVMQEAVETVAAPFDAAVRRALRAALGNFGPTADKPPAFVDALAAQPRAGITCPGKPRILLEPPENHADHCLTVAVYGVLLASSYDADPGRVFVAALAHHLHNAGLPDSGFTGEVLLGRHLDKILAFHTETGLRQLPPGLRGMVEDARTILPDAGTGDGRAFHAADALDRVLQTTQYMRAASLTMSQMLDEMELVHAGPVKPFQDGVLREAGLR